MENAGPVVGAEDYNEGSPHSIPGRSGEGEEAGEWEWEEAAGLAVRTAVGLAICSRVSSRPC